MVPVGGLSSHVRRAWQQVFENDFAALKPDQVDDIEQGKGALDAEWECQQSH